MIAHAATIPDAQATASSRAAYLLCVGRAQSLALPDSHGFEPDQPLILRVRGPLAAIAIDLPLDYLAGEDAEARLADVAWLSLRAIRHEELLQGASRTGPVMPARFGAVFSSASSLDAMLDARSAQISRFLDECDGCCELHVKALIDRDAALDAHVSDLLGAPAAGAEGRGARYLAERRIRQQASHTLREAVDAWVGALAHSLGQACRSTRTTPTGADEEGLEAVATIACLVESARLGDFQERFDSARAEFASAGMQLVGSGPWPLYSFVPEWEATPP